MIKLCTELNFCQFEDGLYKYNDALPMGSPLSGLLADFFIDKLETSFLQPDNEYNKYILFWKRYVDDILIIWDESSPRSLTELLQHVNTLHEKIEFTMENEHNGEINYLDLTLKRHNGEIKFDIYRKPTQTDVVIPFDSFHHYSHKCAAFNAYIHRLYDTPLTHEQIENEIKIIETIAHNNKYPPKFVNNLINKYTHKHINLDINDSLIPLTKNILTYRSINYPGDLSTNIQRIFKKYNISISFKTNSTLLNTLSNVKNQSDILLKNGVYSLECDTCSATYIGETGRNLKQRIKEHKLNENSNFGRHFLTHNHVFDEKRNVKLLHHQGKGYKLTLLEAYEIDRFIHTKTDLHSLNDQVQLQKTPLYRYLNNPYDLKSEPPDT
nr:uncharacterized protein LOC111421491 [Onthophagus taurus]